MVAPQIGETLGHYRIVEKIAEGGMGVVYRAHDERLDRDVALKVLPPDEFANESVRARFRREALTLSKLSHPNIATVFDFDTHGTLDFLVMEYVEGLTLAEKLGQGRLREKEVLALAIQIAKALEDAHEHGVVHCDLKPGNVMVTPNRQVKLLDFGLAKLLRISATATTESVGEIHKFAGTLPYMSPEQLRGSPADFRSDIYSAGVVLYEMSTGRRPFEEKLSTALVDDILHKPPLAPAQFNSSLSPRLQDVIMKCLEKEHDDRYQSARELAVDLRRLASATSIPTETPTPGRSSWRRMSRIVYITAIAGTIGLLALIGFIVWSSRGKPGKRQVVLIGDFQNRTDERVFDNTIPELLTVSLEQSGYTSVFPTSRTSEVLRLMARSPSGPIDEATGREICQREALNAVILGSITKLGSRYVLTARAISPGGHNLASAEDVVGDAGELPASLDRISRYLRKALGESKRQIEESSVPVAEVTTPSLEAIRSFSAGKQKLYAGSLQDARADFEKALELDPAFAMAHEYLGIAYLHQGNPVRAEEELKKTLPLIDHVTEQEKQKILGDYNFLRRDFDQAIFHYKRLKEMRPRDTVPSLNLAQCFVGKRNFDTALAETKAAIEGAPAPGPENNLAEIYLLKGDVGSAFRTAEDIVMRDPSNVRGLENLGWAYVLKNQPAEARRIFEHMVELGSDAESRGRSALADMALASGRAGEAKRQLEVGMAVDRQLGNSFAARKKQILMATTALEAGGHIFLADRERDQVGNDPQLLFLAGLVYARANLPSELAKTYGRLDAAVNNNGVPTMQSFREMLGAKSALLNNDPSGAVQAAERAVAFEPSTLALEILAESYAAARRPREAVDAYEKVLARSAERSQSYDAPAYHRLIEIHYRLGVLYDGMGETSAARSHLEQFLSWWSHPDGKSKIYSDAKARLRRLAAESKTGIPTPAMYIADSVTPSIPSSFSISESLNAMVQKGAK
jgi:serine/threonine protein kinase/tetratricopeptide (TPR) repeat protein